MSDKEEIEFFIPEKDENISEDGKIYIKLYDIKMNGARWRFYKNDKDPRPSNPHGHNLETGDKMDIWTGKVYDKNNNLIDEISSKKLLFVQSKLREADFT